MGYVYFRTSNGEAEGMFIDSLLRSEGVRFIVANEMSRMMSRQVFLADMVFMVHPADLERAHRLLEDYKDGPPPPKARFTRKRASNRVRKNKRRRSHNKEDEDASEVPDRSKDFAVAFFLILVAILLIVISSA